MAGDFNADGKDDIAALYDYGGGTCQMHVFLTNSAGTEVEGGYWQTWYACTTAGYYYANQVTGRMVAGDFNGDGKDDIAALYDYTYYDATDSGQVQVFRSTGTDFASKAWWSYGGKRAYDAS